jgi:hypothetical protein
MLTFRNFTVLNKCANIITDGITAKDGGVGVEKKTSMHYKVLFITKSIMETEYDILMTAI